MPPNYDFNRLLEPEEFQNFARDILQIRENEIMESFRATKDGGIDMRTKKDGKLVIGQVKRYRTYQELFYDNIKFSKEFLIMEDFKKIFPEKYKKFKDNNRNRIISDALSTIIEDIEFFMSDGLYDEIDELIDFTYPQILEDFEIEYSEDFNNIVYAVSEREENDEVSKRVLKTWKQDIKKWQNRIEEEEEKRELFLEKEKDKLLGKNWKCLNDKDAKEIIEKNLQLESHIHDIKQCMFLEINEAIDRLKNIFAECGMIFQVVKNFTGAPVQGFIKKINNKVVLSMTIRGAFADVFWFSLFHEIGHLINGDIVSNNFIDFAESKSDMEDKADEFARNSLIDLEDYEKFINQENITEDKIIKFAKEQEVQPFIVVGRIQKDKNNYRLFYRLKVRYAL